MPPPQGLSLNQLIDQLTAIRTHVNGDAPIQVVNGDVPPGNVFRVTGRTTIDHRGPTTVIELDVRF